MRHVLAALALVLIAAPGSAGARPTLRFGVTASAAGWTDPATAQAAARPLLDAIAAGAKLTVFLEAGLTRAQLLAKLKSGELNAASASADDYLAIAREVQVVPVLRGTSLGASSFRLLVVVDAASGISRLSGLAGQSVSIHGSEAVQRLFLETLLAREKAGQVTVREKKDNQSPVLDVLFREARACVVSAPVFTAMAELNPQLKKKLVVIARSEPLSTPPLFLRQDVAAEVRSAVIHHGARVHLQERGRQILLLFRMGQLVPTRSEDYQSLRDLIAEHARLTGGRKAGP